MLMSSTYLCPHAGQNSGTSPAQSTGVMSHQCSVSLSYARLATITGNMPLSNLQCPTRCPMLNAVTRHSHT